VPPDGNYSALVIAVRTSFPEPLCLDSDKSWGTLKFFAHRSLVARMCYIPNLVTLPFWRRSAEVLPVSLAEIDLTRPSGALAPARIFAISHYFLSMRKDSNTGPRLDSTVDPFLQERLKVMLRGNDEQGDAETSNSTETSDDDQAEGRRLSIPSGGAAASGCEAKSLVSVVVSELVSDG
jgi:hypothetical protein